jgi:hypothetical protein
MEGEDGGSGASGVGGRIDVMSVAANIGAGVVEGGVLEETVRASPLVEANSGAGVQPGAVQEEVVCASTPVAATSGVGLDFPLDPVSK